MIGSDLLAAVPRVAVLDGPAAEARLQDLADILVDAVRGGASVSFMLPFGREDAAEYWRHVLGRVEAGQVVLLGASTGDRLDGTVQLHLDTPPNQPHRADVAKLLVHSRARRGGLGRALMAVVEAEALRFGRRLLTLDTLTDNPAARLYAGLGYTRAGEIPGYALMPDGSGPEATAVFWKRLDTVP